MSDYYAGDAVDEETCVAANPVERLPCRGVGIDECLPRTVAQDWCPNDLPIVELSERVASGFSLSRRTQPSREGELPLDAVLVRRRMGRGECGSNAEAGHQRSQKRLLPLNTANSNPVHLTSVKPRFSLRQPFIERTKCSRASPPVP
jgi:hypothetical protein